MSRSPFSETRIGLFASVSGAITLARFSRKRRIIRSHAAVHGAQTDHASATDRFAAILSELDIADQSVKVVLGGPQNRYFALGASASLKDAAEWSAFAQARAARLYGGDPGDWRASLSTINEGGRVAAVIHRGELEALLAAAQSVRARVKAIIPYLSFEIDRSRSQFPDSGRNWIVLFEPEYAAVIGRDGARVLRIFHHRLRGQGCLELCDHLAREEVLLGWAPESGATHWQVGEQLFHSSGKGSRTDGAQAAMAAWEIRLQDPGALLASMLH